MERRYELVRVPGSQDAIADAGHAECDGQRVYDRNGLCPNALDVGLRFFIPDVQKRLVAGRRDLAPAFASGAVQG